MAQTQKEILRDTIMVKMYPYLDTTEKDMLHQVLTEALYNLKVEEMQTLPATNENTNEYIMQLFMVRKGPKVSQRTVEFYLDYIKHLCDFINKSLLDITEMDIEMYLQHYRKNGNKGRGNSTTTVNNARRSISAFYTWMRQAHLLTENPCESIEKYREIEKPIDYMEDWEMETLRDICKDNIRNRAIIEVLRSTAVRVGELVTINQSDVDWKTGNIVVYGEKNLKYRTVCLDAVAKYHLKKYLDMRTDNNQALFVHSREPYGRLQKSGVRAVLKSIMQKSDLDRRVYPHLFRKSTATKMVSKGCPRDLVAFYLGHANGDTKTLNKHYVHTDPAQIQRAFWQYGAA